MPLIAIDEDNKTRLDKIAVKLAEEQGVKSVTYATVIAYLLTLTEVK